MMDSLTHSEPYESRIKDLTYFQMQCVQVAWITVLKLKIQNGQLQLTYEMEKENSFLDSTVINQILVT
jgi:hypothetical protein